jgi:hypothetical protein
MFFVKRTLELSSFNFIAARHLREDGLRIIFKEVAGAVSGDALRFTAASPVGKAARSKRFCLTEASNLIDKKYVINILYYSLPGAL